MTTEEGERARPRVREEAAPAPAAASTRPPARFLFFGTEGFPPTVYDAQVLDLLRVLDRAGLRFDLLNLDPLLPRTLLSSDGRSRLRRLAGLLPGRLLVRPYVPFEDRAGAPLARLLLSLHLRRALRGEETVVVHARGLWAAYVAVRVARRAPARVRVVYDARGDYEAEHAFHVTGRGDARGDRRARAGLARIRRAEGIALARADRVLCVSRALARALAARHPAADVGAKVDVIPCGHDPDRFRLDPAARVTWRASLGLEGKFVVCYAGSLVPYQLPERIVRAGVLARRLRPDAHLLLLTPDVERGAAMLRAAGLGPDAATARKAPHDDMPGLLNAADLGLLLRRRDPVNAVASPVKLAEYLACGLPVIVSDGIGDASALVREGRAGAALDDVDDDLHLERALRQVMDAPPPREAVARFARERLARDGFLDVYLRVYRGLAGA